MGQDMFRIMQEGFTVVFRGGSMGPWSVHFQVVQAGVGSVAVTPARSRLRVGVGSRLKPSLTSWSRDSDFIAGFQLT